MHKSQSTSIVINTQSMFHELIKNPQIIHIFNLKCYLYTETFGASAEKKNCEESCQQPCTHTEYETSLSYATLQKNVLINKLNSAARTVKLYKHFLNKSESKKEKYLK